MAHPGRSPGVWTARMKQSAQVRTDVRSFTRKPRMSIRSLSAASAVLLSLAASAILFSGCKKEPEKAVVLAQVGNSTLTLEELRESFPPEFEQLIRREQYLDFIKRWMDDEAVYQQALKAKIETDPVVGRKLEKLRRKLLIEEYLARENATEVFEPDEMSMNQYYEMHKEEFRRKVPEVKFAQMRLQTSKQATDLRSKANRGDFLAVATANSLDPVPESYSSIAFKKQTDFPPCLSQDIASAGIGAVTLPVACPDGYYLVKVIERQDAGSLIPFAEAKEEISGILVMERKDKLMEGKISKFKEGLLVTYNLDQIPGLAESPKGAEAVPAVPATATATAPADPAAAKPLASPAATATATAPSAASAAPPVPAKTATAPAQDSRLPREPAFIGSVQGSLPNAQVGVPPSGGATATTPANAAYTANPAKAKYSYRKRAQKPAHGADSLETKAAAPKPATETTPETPGQKPEAEENSNAQPPIDTP
jgi:parvulin-like peptidyl-prolyl isomerase